MKQDRDAQLTMSEDSIRIAQVNFILINGAQAYASEEMHRHFLATYCESKGKQNLCGTATLQVTTRCYALFEKPTGLFLTVFKLSTTVFRKSRRK